MNSPESCRSVDSPVCTPDVDTEIAFMRDLEKGKPMMTKSPSLHKMKQEGNYSKVLVVYTGGTIGMLRTENGVYAPVENEMVKKIKTYPQLHDQKTAEEYLLSKHEDNILILPDTGDLYRVVYVIQEYNPLLDSSNMTMDDWIKIAMDIKAVLHFANRVRRHSISCS